VTDKRDFKSQFLLKDGQLVPLFNLSSLLNSKSKKETIPFLSYFLPGKVDDDNSSYQVFLRFRFDEKLKTKQKKAEISQDQIVELESATKTVELENIEDIVGVDSLDKKDKELANELLVN
jgi:hypothetical protein